MGNKPHHPNHVCWFTFSWVFGLSCQWKESSSSLACSLPEWKLSAGEGGEILREACQAFVFCEHSLQSALPWRCDGTRQLLPSPPRVGAGEELFKILGFSVIPSCHSFLFDRPRGGACSRPWSTAIVPRLLRWRSARWPSARWPRAAGRSERGRCRPASACCSRTAPATSVFPAAVTTVSVQERESTKGTSFKRIYVKSLCVAKNSLKAENSRGDSAFSYRQGCFV